MARVSEELLQSRVQLGKRGRECALLQEKIEFADRVNGELRGLLEAHEAEELRRGSARDAEVRGLRCCV